MTFVMVSYRCYYQIINTLETFFSSLFVTRSCQFLMKFIALGFRSGIFVLFLNAKVFIFNLYSKQSGWDGWEIMFRFDLYGVFLSGEVALVLVQPYFAIKET